MIEDSKSDEEETQEACPLCGGEFVEFMLQDIKVPEKNIYTWIGYFDN
jgi:C4-type Zn-finger protein